jgi:hypothetical protein
MSNGWIQIGHHTKTCFIVQGYKLDGAGRAVSSHWGRSMSRTRWGHWELFSRGASWSHANPCNRPAPQSSSIRRPFSYWAARERPGLQYSQDDPKVGRKPCSVASQRTSPTASSAITAWDNGAFGCRRLLPRQAPLPH